jgi:site-specific recombinase XerD
MSKLRQAMIDAMLVRGFAVRTHQSYLSAVTGLAKYYRRSPVQLNTGEIQDYFLYLVKERHLSPASCRLSLNGIRFLYKEVLQREFEAKIQVPKRSQRIPELLTRKEVAAIAESEGAGYRWRTSPTANRSRQGRQRPYGRDSGKLAAATTPLLAAVSSL